MERKCTYGVLASNGVGYYRVGEETKDLFDVGGALKGIYEAELRSCELISESIPAVSFVEFSPDGSRICWK